MSLDVNKATRIMRAGNEFSETNRKLREAVWSFIEWLFEHIGDYQLPAQEEIGWAIKRIDDHQILISFKKEGGWYSVTTNSDEALQMNHIVMLCRALAGPEGEKLVQWLEEQAQERAHMFKAVEEAIVNLRLRRGSAIMEHALKREV